MVNSYKAETSSILNRWLSNTGVVRILPKDYLCIDSVLMVATEVIACAAGLLRDSLRLFMYIIPKHVIKNVTMYWDDEVAPWRDV